MNNKKLSLMAAVAALSLLSAQGALAQKKYDTGASDTEIKIGNVEAYSGPASAYGVIGKTEEAYFKMINDAGGIKVTADNGWFAARPSGTEDVYKIYAESFKSQQHLRQIQQQAQAAITAAFEAG